MQLDAVFELLRTSRQAAFARQAHRVLGIDGFVGAAAGYGKINMVQSEVIDMVNKINSGHDYVVYRDGAKITIAARLVPWCKKIFAS